MALYRALFSVFPFAQPFLQTTRRPTSHIAIAARTPMPPPTYLQRVQQVLSDLAKKQQPSISWDAMLRHFAAPSGGDDHVCSPHVRRHVENALRREIIAHRVLKLHEGDDTVVSITDQGVQFYLSWGQLTLYEPEDPRFQRMTVAEVKRRSGVLRQIVHDICDTFLEHKPNLAVHDDIDRLPTSVSELIASVDELENDNVALQLQRNDDEKDRRKMQAQFRAGDSSSDEQ